MNDGIINGTFALLHAAKMEQFSYKDLFLTRSSFYSWLLTIHCFIFSFNFSKKDSNFTAICLTLVLLFRLALEVCCFPSPSIYTSLVNFIIGPVYSNGKSQKGDSTESRLEALIRKGAVLFRHFWTGFKQYSFVHLSALSSPSSANGQLTLVPIEQTNN